jgi:two-component system sensor kinase FixL
MAIGDPIQIQQVVINLIKYAREAVSRSERMQLTISMLEKDGMAEVSFHNSGPGIPAGGIATLFDTLALNNSDVTSLGLSISRTIVEAHSGKLTAQNHAEGGSTFIFTIPLASPARTGRV